MGSIERNAKGRLAVWHIPGVLLISYLFMEAATLALTQCKLSAISFVKDKDKLRCHISAVLLRIIGGSIIFAMDE